MPEFDYDKLVKLVKANGEIKQSEAAQKMGLTVGQVSMINFCRAQVEAGVFKKAPGTEASIKKLRNSEGNRWELIAARTGLSVSQVKDLYGGEDAAKSSYTGRGRNFNADGTTARSGSTRGSSTKTGSKSKTKAAGKAKTATKAGTKKSASKRGGIVRNRGGRRSTAANPS